MGLDLEKTHADSDGKPCSEEVHAAGPVEVTSHTSEGTTEPDCCVINHGPLRALQGAMVFLSLAVICLGVCVAILTTRVQSEIGARQRNISSMNITNYQTLSDTKETIDQIIEDTYTRIRNALDITYSSVNNTIEARDSAILHTIEENEKIVDAIRNSITAISQDILDVLAAKAAITNEVNDLQSTSEWIYKSNEDLRAKLTRLDQNIERVRYACHRAGTTPAPRRSHLFRPVIMG